MHKRFGLTLAVNHACNLRCGYCYTGAKTHRPMPLEIGRRAIDRAVQSLLPGGTLELGFFGGEPLVEAARITEFIAYADERAAELGMQVELGMTTNGTLDGPAAWTVMTMPRMRLAISCDGLPEVHDRHRLTREGGPTSARVLQTIARVVAAGKEFRVVLVVRPDNVNVLRSGLEFLYACDVRRFDPSLDLWTRWTRRDGEVLARSIEACADFWVRRLPDCAVSWYDEQAARLARVPVCDSARCGFGHAEIAVAPSGNLYPCERLLGADAAGNEMRLPGHALDGEDFLGGAAAAGRSANECAPCALRSICSTTCRCSNYVRTGDVGRPDALLCLWSQACHRETVRALKTRVLSLT